jgi:hypothetical protein
MQPGASNSSQAFSKILNRLIDCSVEQILAVMGQGAEHPARVEACFLGVLETRAEGHIYLGRDEKTKQLDPLRRARRIQFGPEMKSAGYLAPDPLLFQMMIRESRHIFKEMEKICDPETVTILKLVRTRAQKKILGPDAGGDMQTLLRQNQFHRTGAYNFFLANAELQRYFETSEAPEISHINPYEAGMMRIGIGLADLVPKLRVEQLANPWGAGHADETSQVWHQLHIVSVLAKYGNDPFQDAIKQFGQPSSLAQQTQDFIDPSQLVTAFPESEIRRILARHDQNSPWQQAVLMAHLLGAIDLQISRDIPDLTVRSVDTATALSFGQRRGRQAGLLRRDAVVPDRPKVPQLALVRQSGP